jgi:6-phosphogluconolactonase
MTRYVYVGTSTAGQSGGKLEGIFVYQMDPQSGSLEQVQSVESGPEPSFLALHPNRRFIYAINEASQGEAAAFELDPVTGRLRFLNRESLEARGPCYVTLSPDGSWLVAANYGGGSLSILPVDTDGRLGKKRQVVQHEGASAVSSQPFTVRDEQGVLATVKHHAAGSGVMPDRQENPHTHCAIFDPGGRFLLAADLGMDRVWVYSFDQESGRVLPVPDGHPAGFAARPGAGPRHLAFHPNGRFLYVSNELDSTVVALSWDGENGTLSPLQNLTTLPDGFTGESWVADIHLTPDGRFLYVSNRGDDSLACFQVDGETGRLELSGHYSTLGNWPRNFGITPDGQFLLAANQNSGTLVVFRLDTESGRLEPSGTVVNVRGPMYVSAVDFV